MMRDVFDSGPARSSATTLIEGSRFGNDVFLSGIFRGAARRTKRACSKMAAPQCVSLIQVLVFTQEILQSSLQLGSLSWLE